MTRRDKNQIKMTKANIATLTMLLLGSSALCGCATADKIASIGQPPAMTKIENPTLQKDYQPISLPMPSPKDVRMERNSLWASNRQTFFKDQRAKDVGDVITVKVSIDDQAKVDNETKRSRTNSEDAAVPAMLGLEGSLKRYLPESVDPAKLAQVDSSSDSQGKGSVDRKEQIEVKLAAMVTQILPNGNMVIKGRQEILVNFEKRILAVDGVIRPEDISIENTISYEQIAEARITYGGEGRITDVQQPRYGQQLYDIVFPF